MKANIAFPFITIPDGLVDFSPWMMGTKDEPLYPASDILENWDYAKDLEVSCGVTLVTNEISNHLHIPLDDLRLKVFLRAGTGKGRFPRKIWELDHKEITSDSGKVELRGQLEGSVLSSKLHLECLIVLNSVPEASHPLSPKKSGSRLWSRQKDILLEDGGDSRFPIESLSFKSAFPGKPHEMAPWYFHWHQGNYHMDFAGATRLYVNEDCVRMHEKIVAGDPLILQSVMYDVISQILAAAVADEVFWEDLHEYSEESIGGQADYWLGMAFPVMPADLIQSLLRNSPGIFNAAILSVAEIGGDL